MPWTLFQFEFLIIWRMSALEKWQLAEKFSFSKVNCDGNTLSSAKKKKKKEKINNVLAKNFALVN